MASRYFGINRGGTASDITESSSTTSKKAELIIDLAQGMSKSDFSVAVEDIKRKVVSGNWPPSASPSHTYAKDQGDYEAESQSPAKATGTITAATVLEGDDVTVEGEAFTAQSLIEEFTVVCGADTAGSLDGLYFDFSTLTEDFRLWLSVDGAGTPPAAGGRTLLEVVIASGAADTAVGAAVRAAINNCDGISATLATATVTATMDEPGACTAAVDGDTGFTIAVARAGADEPDADSFSIHGTDEDVAASLAAAIEANATVSALMDVSVSGAVVTLTSKIGGTAGNAYTLVSSGATLAVTGSGTLEDGAAAAGGDVAFVVDMDSSIDRSEAVRMLGLLHDKAISTNWPQA